ncbi:alpha/beta fold hydrolase [Plastoroseomonas arctica]|uniref:Alpha/beta fold hydrolase n=1 Tax=Plastoroseomonas arctica TaxID=1509237 RepID=A0AAF1KQ34_9PROT|nr:alpha/beta fold hydrolase [Plastoroseomonas arctica]MBR0656983.1 alpha/beta fold hydrolase [Plastoroseomonas arctica]
MTQTEPLPELAAGASRMTTPCGGVADGLCWYRWGPDAGIPVVLFHGGSGSWRHWARNIADLAARRPVIAPDLPGLGTSAMPDDPAGPEEAAAALLAGLPGIVQGRFHLVGFSFGAMVSGLVAAEAPGLASLSLVGPAALGTPRQPVPLEKLRDKQGEGRREAHRANLRALMLHNPDTIDDTAIGIQEWNTIHARLRSRGFATSTRLRDALPRIAAPVQAIWGARDQVAYPALDERVDVLRAARPDATITLIPDTGHWAAYEAPDAVNALLQTFIARHDR